MPVTESARKVIRIALADDHTLFRAGLRKLLSAEKDFQVVADVGNALRISDFVETYCPDILLLELRMSGVSGLEVLRQLRAAGTSTRVLVLTASEDEQELAQAMKLGASGVVLKTSGTPLLIQAIRKVSNGEIWLDGAISAELIKRLTNSRTTDLRSQDAAGLTPREREIASLVGQGYRYREIAELLSISEQTVKNHLRSIFHKLGVSDRLQLALFAIHHNL